MKKFFAAIALLWASAAFGQVFTTLYLPTQGAGLTLNIAAGRAFCGGSIASYSGGTLAMAASVTNRVYLNTASSCVPAVKSSAFTSSDIPIATVVTSGSAITGVTDNRTMFNQMLVASQVVGSINGSPGAFTFSGPGVSCTGTTCTFTGGTFSNPMTTLGDFIVGGSSGTPQRLGVGSDGQVVTADHTATNGVKWGTPAASGVQYDASNTDFVFSGTSFWSDDLQILGQVINVSSGTCTGVTCSIVNTGNNHFSAGDWIEAAGMTGWPAATSPYGNGSFNNAGYSDVVQISATGLSSTTFQFSSPLTATITGGSVENANQFSTMQFSRLPFANGHGLIHGVFGANHRCSDVDTNYTTLIHPLSPAVTGHPGYLILNGCGNDIGAGDSVATVEGHLQSIWQKAHTDSFVMVQGNMIIGNPGSLVTGDHTFKLSQLNDWIEGQGQRFDTLTPYCTTSCGMNWDRALDFHAAMSNLAAPNMFASNGGVGTGGAVATANIVNEALVNKATSFKTQNAFSYYGWFGSTLPFNEGPGWIWSAPQAVSAFVITDGDQTNVAFSADTKSSGGGVVGIRVPQILVSSLAASSSICTDGNKRLTTSACAGSGISGATAGQALIAGSATTATSSKALAGTGTGLVTGPTTSTAGDLLTYLDTSGTTQDSGTLLSSLAPKASPTFTGTPAAPTAAPGTNTTQLASTAFVQAAVTAGGTAFSGGLGTSFQDVTEIAAPANPAAGNDRLYTNSTTHKMACLTSGGADCMPAAGVSAFSGDGALLSNSSSTGSVTATLANAAAHKFWGNNTGSTAAPGYESITAADLTGIRQWSCQPGLGDGLNAITAGTYLQSTCKNTTGVTVTLTGLQCFTDNSGTSTMNAAGNTLGALLTGAVTCTSSFAAGTQSANVALTNGDYVKFTFVADGTSKQTTWVVTGTY